VTTTTLADQATPTNHASPEGQFGRLRQLSELSGCLSEAVAVLLDELPVSAPVAGLAAPLEQARQFLAGRSWNPTERTAIDHFLVDALTTVHRAGRVVHHGMTGAPGVVAQLSRSDGGVPKLPIDRAEIGRRGLVGDRQRSRAHHGRPWQALCLWSTEVIGELRRQGHPIFPGAAGENVTISGLDWSRVKPGMQLVLGSVVAELSMWAEPCGHNARWFSDGDFARIHASCGPVSRVYATVLRPGTVSRGDALVVVP
jgi:MOSC domain-containing protein YiiM